MTEAAKARQRFFAAIECGDYEVAWKIAFDHGKGEGQVCGYQAGYGSGYESAMGGIEW